MIDDQDERIAKIFGIEELEDIEDEGIEVNEETLEKYFNYLKERVEIPCKVISGDEFGWEEPYTFGPGNAEEYEKLKKTRPSYTDKFILLSFKDEIDLDEGIMVNVQRVSDKKKFLLPVADLEATDKKSINYQLLDDYSVWYANN